jgi:hypothetical protein
MRPSTGGPPALIFLVLAACGGAQLPMPGADGESCEKPFRLRAGTLEGTTVGFRDDEGTERSSCGGGGAPDVVITFTAATGTLVSATVTTVSPGFRPVLKLRGADTGCIAADAACRSAIARGEPAELKDWAPALGGLQYAIIDGEAGTSGPFTLTLVVR